MSKLLRVRERESENVAAGNIIVFLLLRILIGRNRHARFRRQFRRIDESVHCEEAAVEFGREKRLLEKEGKRAREIYRE